MLDVLDLHPGALDALAAVHNRVRPDDPTSAEELADWGRQAESATWLLARLDGEDAGGAVGVTGWHAPPETAYAVAWTVLPARGRGVGLALHERLVRWCRERGCTALETAVDEDDEGSLAWAERRGFREIGRDSQFALELGPLEAPAVDAPEGVVIVSWAERPGIERGLYDVYREAEPDIPGEERNELLSFERWLEHDMRGVSDRPEGVFAALAGDDVVGYAKLAFPPVETGNAFHDLTGVRREWRGRGVAAALRRAQIAWAKEQGFRRLVTRNEQRNQPIRRINVRQGYRMEPGSVSLRLPL